MEKKKFQFYSGKTLKEGLFPIIGQKKGSCCSRLHLHENRTSCCCCCGNHQHNGRSLPNLGNVASMGKQTSKSIFFLSNTSLSPCCWLLFIAELFGWLDTELFVSKGDIARKQQQSSAGANKFRSEIRFGRHSNQGHNLLNSRAALRLGAELMLITK